MSSRLLTLCLAALLAHSAGADSLYKCIDARGKVTYSNLPCHNAREAHKLAIDPAPPPERTRSTKNPQQDETAASRAPAAEPRKKASVVRSTSRCENLSERIGRVLDKMDAARRQGYTLKQRDDWNQEIKDLERQKQQAGCF